MVAFHSGYGTVMVIILEAPKVGTRGRGGVGGKETLICCLSLCPTLPQAGTTFRKLLELGSGVLLHEYEDLFGSCTRA